MLGWHIARYTQIMLIACSKGIDKLAMSWVICPRCPHFSPTMAEPCMYIYTLSTDLSRYRAQVQAAQALSGHVGYPSSLGWRQAGAADPGHWYSGCGFSCNSPQTRLQNHPADWTWLSGACPTRCRRFDRSYCYSCTRKQLKSGAAEHKSECVFTRNTPYLALTGKMWGACYEGFGENLRYNGTTL